jgi:hypothetical protein
VGEHFSVTLSRHASVARYPNLQSQGVTDHRHIGDPPDHGVAVDTLGAAARTIASAVVEQLAEHHRCLAVDGGVGDRHPEFDGPHNRVGDNSSRQRRRVRHRAPRWQVCNGVRTCILCRPGPVSAHRHDLQSRPSATLTSTPFPEEPINRVQRGYGQPRLEQPRRLMDPTFRGSRRRFGAHSAVLLVLCRVARLQQIMPAYRENQGFSGIWIIE